MNINKEKEDYKENQKVVEYFRLTHKEVAEFIKSSLQNLDTLVKRVEESATQSGSPLNAEERKEEFLKAVNEFVNSLQKFNDILVNKEYEELSPLAKQITEIFSDDEIASFIDKFTVTVKELLGKYNNIFNRDIRLPDKHQRIKQLLHIVEEFQKTLGDMSPQGSKEVFFSVTPEQQYKEELSRMLKEGGLIFDLVVKAVDMVNVRLERRYPVFTFKGENFKIIFARESDDSYRLAVCRKESITKELLISVNKNNNIKIERRGMVEPGKVLGATASELAKEINGSLRNFIAQASSALKKEVGGIDLTKMKMLIQPQGSFASSSLDFSLPMLNRAEIESFDLDKELTALQRMASSGIAPHPERFKAALAACFARGKTGREIDGLKSCLEDVLEQQQ